jgi:hypothetical protein
LEESLQQLNGISHRVLSEDTTIYSVKLLLPVVGIVRDPANDEGRSWLSGIDQSNGVSSRKYATIYSYSVSQTVLSLG